MDWFENLQMIVRRVTYKPGWKFNLGTQNFPKHPYDPLNLYITRDEVADVDGPGKTTTLTFIASIDQETAREMLAEEFVRHFIGTAIRDFEMHELDEWFKLDGKCVFEPKH